MTHGRRDISCISEMFSELHGSSPLLEDGPVLCHEWALEGLEPSAPGRSPLCPAPVAEAGR